MSRQLKNKLMGLLTGPKKTDNPVTIFYDDGQTSEMRIDDKCIIVFVDFRKENEMALKKQEIKSGH